MWNRSVMRMLMLLILSFALAWSPASQAMAAGCDCCFVDCPFMQRDAQSDEQPAPADHDSKAPCAIAACVAACAPLALPAQAEDAIAPPPAFQAKAFAYDRIAMRFPSLDPPVPR